MIHIKIPALNPPLQPSGRIGHFRPLDNEPPAGHPGLQLHMLNQVDGRFWVDHSRYQEMPFLIARIHRRPFGQQELFGVQTMLG
jgi:hypothetical protein